MSEEKERRVAILTGCTSPAQRARTVEWLKLHGTDVVLEVSPTGRIPRDQSLLNANVHPADNAPLVPVLDFAALEQRALAYIARDVMRHRSGLLLDAPPDRYCDDRGEVFRALYGSWESKRVDSRYKRRAMRQALNKRKAQRRARTGRK